MSKPQRDKVVATRLHPPERYRLLLAAEQRRQTPCYLIRRIIEEWLETNRVG